MAFPTHGLRAGLAGLAASPLTYGPWLVSKNSPMEMLQNGVKNPILIDQQLYWPDEAPPEKILESVN
jgi:hypothetical protein